MNPRRMPKEIINTPRPSYRDLNLLGFWITTFFVPFNLVLALYLWVVKININLPLLHARGWAIVYTVVALWLWVALKKDNLKAIKWGMLIGFFAKIYFMYILLLTAHKTGFLHNLSILDLWAMVASVQALTIIFLIPREVVIYGGPRTK